MKRLLGILVLVLLWCSNNANAGLEEPGNINIHNDCIKGFEEARAEARAYYLKKQNKKLQTVVYGSCNVNGRYRWQWNGEKSTNLKELHKKSYEQCSKHSKKISNGECFLYSINDEVVWEFYHQNWRYDPQSQINKNIVIKKNIITDVYNEEKYVSSNRSGKFVNLSDEGFVKYTEQHNLTYKNPKDNIPGRFLFDQEDVTDDYQMHAIYVLASDSKDKQFDLKGIIEKIVLKANRHMKKKTKEKQFRLDLTKEGKLDVSFLRVPLTKKELNQHKDGTVYLAATAVRNGFYHPKKIYMLLYQDKYKDERGQLGDAILKTPTGNVEIQMGVTYLEQNMFNKPHLHETFHALGFTQLCAPGYAKTGPPRWDGRQDHLNFSNDIMSDRDSGNRNIDRKRKHYYGHSNKDCPLDLRKSVFLEPTEKDPQLPPRTKTCRVARWVKNYNHQRSLDCMAKLDF